MTHIGIFLDRDGTINHEVDFLRTPEQLTLIPGSADAIREANGCGWKVFVITNQSAVARGFLTEEKLAGIHAGLGALLRKHNAAVDAMYYCPHHPELGLGVYRMACDCRKPNTGMLTRAAHEFNVDLKKSFVIGDKMTDVQTGINGGATSILVLTGYGKEELRLCRENHVPIDHVAESLYEAMQYVKSIVQYKQPSLC